MAQRVSNSPEAQRHYAAQAALAAALAAAVARVRVTQTGPYVQAVAALTREFSFGSISVASDYYADARESAGVADRFAPPLVEPWSLESTEAYLETAIEGIRREAQGLADLAELGRKQVEGTAETLMLDAGRSQIITSAKADRANPRWARIARPEACSFCLMLATRGAVYRTESTAEFRAHMPFDGKGGVCHCSIEMVFNPRDYEPPDYIAEKASLWAETSIPGDPKESRRAFRRAVEADR